MTTLTDLIARVEAAEGPDRELDAEIDWTVSGYRGHHPQPNAWGDVRGYWRECTDGPLRKAPAYTASASGRVHALAALKAMEASHEG